MKVIKVFNSVELNIVNIMAQHTNSLLVYRLGDNCIDITVYMSKPYVYRNWHTQSDYEAMVKAIETSWNNDGKY